MREEVQPLPSPQERPLMTQKEEAFYHGNQIQRKRKCNKCCTIITSLLLLIISIVMVVLIFTVFKGKNPIIYLNGVTFGDMTSSRASSITVKADVSVKNPNDASFSYGNTTSTLYYNGEVMGEARAPAGTSQARRTVRMNATVEIFTDFFVSNPTFARDISGGVLEVESYSEVGGEVEILNVMKKHVVVKMNCSFVVNMTSMFIQHQNCKRKIKF